MDQTSISVSYEAIFDKEISWQASGLLIALQSLPPHFEITKKSLVEFGKGKYDFVNSAFEELIKAGWVDHSVQKSASKGKFPKHVYRVRQFKSQILPAIDAPNNPNFTTPTNPVLTGM